VCEERTTLVTDEGRVYCIECHNDVRHRVVYARLRVKIFSAPVLAFDRRWEVECPACSCVYGVTKGAALSERPFAGLDHLRRFMRGARAAGA
jgi:hypothetical protein